MTAPQSKIDALPTDRHTANQGCDTPALADAKAHPHSHSLVDDFELADAIPHILWIQDDNGTVTYFNRNWCAYTGLSLEETLRVGAVSAVHPDDRAALVQLFSEAQQRGASLETYYRLRCKTGVYRWHVARVVPLRRDGDRVLSWLGTATNVDEWRRLQEQQSFFLKASTVLGTSLDLDRTLSDVARLVVPQLANWCAIDLLTEAGELERKAIAHVDAAKIELARELWRLLPPRPDDPRGAWAVIRSGQPELTAKITDEMLAEAIHDPTLLSIYRSLGLCSAMVVPLRVREIVLGALTLVSAESEHIYDEQDLTFAVELAARIAVAVDNAQLYGEAMRARSAAEALATDVLEQSRAMEAALLTMRRERDDALARLGPGSL